MYSPLRYAGHILWKSSPIHLTLFLTRRCNSRCPYCFYLRGKANTIDDRDELTLDEIERLSRSSGNLLWIAFSGGEIFLREDLAEISRIIYQQNKPTVMLYPTNGLLPETIRNKTEQILKTCPKSVITIKLSLDGLREKHDLLRGVPGNFDQLLETYRLIGELQDRYPNLELGINTIFLSENQAMMPEIIEFVSGLNKIRTHTISLIRGSFEQGYQHVSLEQYQQAMKMLRERDSRGRSYRFFGAQLKMSQDIMQRQLIYQTMQKKQRIIPCYAGRLNLVLRETGDVYPCESFNDTLGNVRDFDYDLKKLMGSKQAREILLRIRQDKCYCSHECYFMTNILFNPWLLTKVMATWLRL